ncbi:MAG: hypothetical protein EOP02_35475, partial [Proteobacteria bacterium]
EYLCAIHERLLRAAEDPRLPSALRDAALRHASKTYAELLGFTRQHGEYPRTHRLLCSAADTDVAPVVTQPDNLPYGVH